MDAYMRANRLCPVVASMGVGHLLLAACGEGRPLAGLFQFDRVVSPGDRAARPDGTTGITTFSSTF